MLTQHHTWSACVSGTFITGECVLCDVATSPCCHISISNHKEPDHCWKTCILFATPMKKGSFSREVANYALNLRDTDFICFVVV